MNSITRGIAYLFLMSALVLIVSACSAGVPERATSARSTTAHVTVTPAPSEQANSSTGTYDDQPSVTATSPASARTEHRPTSTASSAPVTVVQATGTQQATATSQPVMSPGPIGTGEPKSTPTPAHVKTLYVNSKDYSEVHLRARPTTRSAIVRSMPYRARVSAAAVPVRNTRAEEWYKVRYGVRSGYVLASLLSERPPKPMPPSLSGVVLDSETGDPVGDAWVYLGDAIERTDRAGRFRFARAARRATLTVMAPGYARFDASPSSLSDSRVMLEPFDARGVFLPFFQAGQPSEVERIFGMIERTTLNSVVIDVKSDDGFVWRSDVPMAGEIGASIERMELREFVEAAHERDIYVIGRFTVFKDPTLAKARQDLAITSTEGGLWKDYSEIAYSDPFEPEVWDYFGDLAEEIAASGIDEIQYDYVRFPVDGDLQTDVYTKESNPDARVKQITAFVEYMEDRLRPSKVFISADIFGLTVWSRDEQGTGQILENVSRHVDYVSPMLYPSGFSRGTNGYDYPTEHSYEIIKDSLVRAQERMDGMPARLRPFLQSFYDYAWGKPYGLPQFMEQREAAEDVGTSGWLYWNAAAKYDERTFRP